MVEKEGVAWASQGDKWAITGQREGKKWARRKVRSGRAVVEKGVK